MKKSTDKDERIEDTAAAWFVAIDAGRTDAQTDARFVEWLEARPEHGAALARCEAAVAMTRHLGDAAKLGLQFDEAARIGAGTETAFHRRRRVLAHPLVAWSAAAAALVVAAIGFLEPGRAPSGVSQPSSDPVTQTLDVSSGSEVAAIDLAGAESAVFLPGPVVVDARSVAVMPFVDVALAAEAAQAERLAASLYDEVLRQLASIPGVYVVDEGAVAPYAAGGIDPAQIAAQLGVRSIVEARVSETGGRVRVLLSLTDAARAGPPIEDAFERPFEEIGQMRTEIVTNIALALADTPVPPAYVPPLQLH